MNFFTFFKLCKIRWVWECQKWVSVLQSWRTAELVPYQTLRGREGRLPGRDECFRFRTTDVPASPPNMANSGMVQHLKFARGKAHSKQARHVFHSWKRSVMPGQDNTHPSQRSVFLIRTAVMHSPPSLRCFSLFNANSLPYKPENGVNAMCTSQVSNRGTL